MSTSPFALDASTRRLLDEDYCLTFVGSHLVVEHVPYVTTERVVAYGRLALPVVFSGETLQDGSGDHRIWFLGSQPCDESGRPLAGPQPEAHGITPDLAANFMISSKPKIGNTFANMYEKVTSYVRVLSHPAIALDPTATARPGSGWTEVPDGLPFLYRDTGTARAGTAALNDKFRGQRIGIIGLGGTGGYILDQVAKTWVDAISLFDGDVFDNHNAFRAPSAASVSELNERPNKADYFANLYSRMHTGITARAEFVTEDNLDLLSDCTFVFMAAADAEDKPAILSWLAERGIPCIEVGMGVRDEDGKLSGLLAVVNHFNQGMYDVEPVVGGVNEYDRNIQTADLNALNAMLAVIEWKKFLGYYAALEPLEEVVYRLFDGSIRGSRGEYNEGIA